MKDRSDKNAKEQYSRLLTQRGFVNVKIIKEPADIVAEKHGEKYYFEIKKTAAQKNYFGAATLTEWRAAYNNPKRFFFVVCQESGTSFKFTEYTPEEFEKYSSIPPFKIFFNIELTNGEKVPTKRVRKTAISVDERKIRTLDKLFHELKID